MKDLDFINNATPAIFGQQDTVTVIINKIKAAVKDVTTDVTTAKNRKTIASYASKVASSKVFLDKLGKEYVSDLKKQAGQVDAIRRDIRTQLDAVKENVRKPLTAWEDEIKDRIEQFNNIDLSNMSSKQIEKQLDKIRKIEIDSSFDKFQTQAKLAKAKALSDILSALDETKAEEERIKREIAEKEAQRQKEIEQAEVKAKAKADAEAEIRIQKVKREAEKQLEQARAVAEKKEEQEKQRIENDKRMIAAREKKANNRKHIAAVNNKTLKEFVEFGIDENQAKNIVVAIAKNKFTYLKLQY